MLLDLRSLLEGEVAVEVEDSRGFIRREGRATPEGVEAIVLFDRVAVRANAAASPAGVRRMVASSTVGASAEANITSVVISARRAAFGQPRAGGSAALAQAPSAGTPVRVGEAIGHASAGVLLQGVFPRTRVGVGVARGVAGIVEVEAVLEEILFLLEVA